MRSIIFGILTLFAITDVKAQDLDSLILYETTEQFLKKLPSCTNATAEIIRSNPNSMELYKFRDTNTKKKIKRAKQTWGIHFKGNDYFNMLYFDDIYIENTFYKLDIVGRYCVIIIDEDEKYFKSDINYGLGLTNVLISEMEKHKNKGYIWSDKSGKKYCIILIDTIEKGNRTLDKNEGSSGSRITKKQLFKKLNINKETISFEKFELMNLEEILKLIDQFNIDHEYKH